MQVAEFMQVIDPYVYSYVKLGVETYLIGLLGRSLISLLPLILAYITAPRVER